jgi:predicted DNA-binding transcriptional regulator YafY
VVRPTARVLALLELLQAGGIRTVAELAEQLAVDERTVRRYVQHLRELDIPVDAVRGRYGGYRLARHYRMPPLMLTDEEALAIVWALLAGTRPGSGPASLPAVQSASAKVRRVLPAALARRIDAVLDTVSFTATGRDDGDDRQGDGGARVLLTMAEAARGRRPVTFGYTATRGHPTQRFVQPHGVVAHRGRLYLTGFDVTRQAVRTFRLDRIVGVRMLEGTFTVPTGTDPVQQVLGPLAATPWRHEVSLRIRADMAHVRSRIPETLASVTPVATATAREDRWLRVFLRAERLEWVAATLAMLDRPFVIEHPHALHDTVAALGHRMVAAARATTDEAAITAWADEGMPEQDGRPARHR